ncbi:MAG: phage tail tape measure protein [Paludibacteraceae bacterium]|nr:phage tail tape measure protein [Paludibacteraceae bacterium]
MADYRIELGVHVRTSEIRKQISTYNANSNNAKLQLGVKLNTADLQKQLQGLNTAVNGKNLLSLNTSSLNTSLDKVEKNINDIKAAMGTLDKGTGMKSLLASVNQISAALDKATKQFAELNANLNNLSGKNFGVNIGLNLGGGNAVSRNAAYGSMVRNETLPQLQQQVTALEGYLQKYYKVADGFAAAQKLVQGTAVATGQNNLLTLVPKMLDTSGSLSSQMTAYKQYIALIKEAAAVKGIDLSPVTSGFSQSADQLVTKAQNVQTGVGQLDDSLQKLKGVFGSGINAEKLSTQLDSIVVDLNEIKTALQGLSQNASLNSLIQSFNNLSTSIEKLIGNATQAKGVLADGLNSSGASAGTQKAIQEQEHLAETTTRAANAVSQSGQKINQAFTQMASAGKLDPLQLQDDITEADRFAAALSRLKNVQSNLGRIEVGKINTSSGVQQLKTLEAQLESLSAEYNETIAEINGMGGVSATQLTTFQNQARTTSLKLDELKAKIIDTKAQLASGIQANFGNYDTALATLEGKFNRLALKPPELSAGLEAVRQALATLKNADSTEAIIAANENYKRVLKEVSAQINLNAAAERNSNEAALLTQQKQQLALKMSNWLRDNSAAAKQFGGEIRNLQAALQSCGNTSGVRQVGEQFETVTLKAKEAGLTSLTFGDRLKKQFAQYSSYFSVYTMFMYTIRALRSMFTQVKEIDSAMTELKKVTNETDAAYNKFLTNAATRAKEIGTTIDGLVSSTADFARLGYSFKDSQKLAEVANIYAVVGDEVNGVEGATESLVSTMAAFKGEMNGMSNGDFAMSIADKFNEIGNNFAISSGGIGEALKRSASSLDAANNTIDESIALITAANTVVQDPEAVGKGYADIKSGYIG